MIAPVGGLVVRELAGGKAEESMLKFRILELLITYLMWAQQQDGVKSSDSISGPSKKRQIKSDP